ncbi:MAG: hypothetical protein U0790_08645 [Isosphaeraceae bacterium]
MKRVLLLILLVMMAAWFVRVARHEPRRPPQPVRDVAGWPGPRERHEIRRAVIEARDEARRATIEAQHEAREAVRQAREDVRQAIEDARHEVHEALAEAGQELGEALREDDEPREDAEAREDAEGIPVPIVRGTRVAVATALPPGPPDELPECPLAEASPEPPAPPTPPAGPDRKHRPAAPPAPPKPPAVAAGPRETREVAGLISATEERAREEARKELDRQVAEWLEPRGVPGSWRPAARQVDDMILEAKVDPVVKDYGTLYVARLTVDVSPQRREGFVRAYQRQLVGRRMVLLGGGLAFLLTCLGAVSGYIRADEATRGYYTNRLRLLAAAGVGAAGTAIYHLIS